METTPDPQAARDALREAERAAAAPFVDYPPTPPWYSPAVGAWFTCLAAIVWYRPDTKFAIPAMIVLIALVGAFVAWHTRVRGTMPTLTGAPRELRGPMLAYAAGVVVIAAVVIPLGMWEPLAGVLATFVLVTAGIAAYEAAYARAARAVRERLE
ncbi:hypothetical protein JVX90_03750 [Gordonia sp. PDNC005]|uniref:hypothetical protein n=1 Tax=unclassified Gordonia (in: high G+C Gram-positive bacteria) TaxID=2657482 RepID=UPI00196575D1|nr:hypothetical protein [Gordonia sp. PDNC005]QRY63358.1 hypothetical protein JVX90_03750 [Gordonia sp. PDNC005]